MLTQTPSITTTSKKTMGVPITFPIVDIPTIQPIDLFNLPSVNPDSRINIPTLDSNLSELINNSISNSQIALSNALQQTTPPITTPFPLFSSKKKIMFLYRIFQNPFLIQL